jgi:hypothetical protein
MMEEESWNFHPERADRERMIETLMEKKSITNHPLRLKRKDGTLVDVLANMDLVPAERETWILGTIVGRQ